MRRIINADFCGPLFGNYKDILWDPMMGHYQTYKLVISKNKNKDLK